MTQMDYGMARIEWRVASGRWRRKNDTDNEMDDETSTSITGI